MPRLRDGDSRPMGRTAFDGQITSTPFLPGSRRLRIL